MKNIAKTVAYTLVFASLLALCCAVVAIILVSLPIVAACVIACYFMYSLLMPAIRSAAAKIKESCFIPYRQLIVFGIDEDSPNGIKLRDIANSTCSEYQGIDLRGVLQHATHAESADEYFFPGDELACFESSSPERLFYGYNDTLYPVRYLGFTYPDLFLHRVRSVLRREESRVIVMKTGFIVAGSRASEIISRGDSPSKGMRRLKMFVPAVESRDTKDMNPTRVALLSKSVVPYDSKSLFLRRYVALIVSSISKNGAIIPALLWDIYKNAEQLAYVTAHKGGVLSDPDTEFLARMVGFAQDAVRTPQFRCGQDERLAWDGCVSLLLGLSQSEGAMFDPVTKRGKLWLVSEFIRSDKFQSALTASALASVGHSLNSGITSKDDIMARMPYLCKQIPGLCEAAYAMAKIEVDGVYEQESLSNVVLYNARRANRELSVLPSVSRERALEDMNGAGAMERFESSVNRALSLLLTSVRDGTTDIDRTSIRDLARNVLSNSHSSDIIATLTICNIQRLGADITLLLGAASTDMMAGGMIAEYILEEARYDCKIASGAVLKLANRQECEIFFDAETRIYPGDVLCERARLTSGTLLQNPLVVAAGESRATEPVREAC
ncbi:hypothetical protein [Anaplasma marginale]|uniref:hypothetical protein n=1 Tax=Anaplasma marginale TaxID=770 RepID=UPI0001B46744|nr:hypothetical protein [Anaplasma marginale]